MKKLMILAAVAVMGFAASAANVQWSTGLLYIPNADGTWSKVAADQGGGSWLATVTFYADDAGQKGEAITGLINLSKSGVNMVGSIGNTTPNLAFDTTYWIDAVVTYTSDAGTQTMNSRSGYFTTKSAGAGTTVVDFQSTDRLNQTILERDVTNFTPTPEPTSGLLMLLGMAGLALKRKRA